MRTRLNPFLAVAAPCACVAAGHAAELRLELEETGPFLPGESVVVNVFMADLGGNEAVGFQAFLSFDGAEVAFIAGSYVPEPFGLPVIPIIVADGEDLDLASGIDVFLGQEGTSDDSHLAVLAFEAVVELCTPTLVFRDHDPPSRITDDTGTAITPLDLVVSTLIASDCNGNEIEDECDIADGTSRDCNGNGVPDECETPTCPADFTGAGGVSDGFVDVLDLLLLLATWGGDSCADFTGSLGVPDGVVDVLDLLALLAAWGPCP